MGPIAYMNQVQIISEAFISGHEKTIDGSSVFCHVGSLQLTPTYGTYAAERQSWEAGGMIVLTMSDRPQPHRRELAAYVEAKNWWRPGHGDLHACLEMYALCADNAYHRIDAYGVKFPTTVVPLRVRSLCAATSTHVCHGRAATSRSAPATRARPSTGRLSGNLLAQRRQRYT